MKAASGTIRETWNLFFQKRDHVSRNSLILHYLPVLKYITERLAAKLPSTVETEDLMSVGIIGMIDAIEKFDPKRRVLFETYCCQRIRGTILDYLRKTDWTPRLVRHRARQLSRTTQKLQSLLGRMPQEEELAAELKLDINAFRRFQRDANAVSLMSLQDNLGRSSEDGDLQEISVIPDAQSPDPFLEIQKRDTKEYATRGLSREEQLIITLYYFEGMTMREIGMTLGISESRVCQIHSSIISRLKACFDRSTLRNLLEAG